MKNKNITHRIKDSAVKEYSQFLITLKHSKEHAGSGGGIVWGVCVLSQKYLYINR